MLVEHTLTVCAKCPVNGLQDVYEVTFRLNRLIKVEELLEKTKEYKNNTLFQEELTQQLANHFECEVESKGSHSMVHTRVLCKAL